MTADCRGCRHAFVAAQLTVEPDGGGYCFECCNETDEKPSLRGALRETLTNIVGGLAKKLAVSPRLVKAKLIGEHYENLAERRRNDEPKRGSVLN